MVTQKPKPKLTYADYAKTPEDERWELISGELIMSPSPKRAHQRNQIKLGSRMSFFAEEKDLGEVYSDFDVVTVGYGHRATRSDIYRQRPAAHRH